MEEGLAITVMGMGIVFVVLFLIFLAIVILGWYEQKFPEPQPVSAPKKNSATTPSFSSNSYSDDEAAAIKGALAMHINKNPDEFEIKIK